MEQINVFSLIRLEKSCRTHNVDIHDVLYNVTIKERQYFHRDYKDYTLFSVTMNSDYKYFNRAVEVLNYYINRYDGGKFVKK